MPMPWMKRIRQTGQLTVHNMGGAWASFVDSAMATFNTLGFGVKLVPERDVTQANIVVKLSNGADSHTHYGNTISAHFRADQLHGRARTLPDRRNEIWFAVVFLPGRVQNATAKQREVVIIHELIHAAGLNGLLPDGAKAPNDDHDSVGIMYPQMMVKGDGLIEYLHDKGAQPMTPVRVGVQTMSKMRSIWVADGANATAPGRINTPGR